MKTIITIMLAFIVSASFAQATPPNHKQASDEDIIQFETGKRPKEDTVKQKTADSVFNCGNCVITSSKINPNFGISSQYSFPKIYTVDWKKVKTFADLKLLMSTINIIITDPLNPKYKRIKKFLIEQK